MNPSALPADDRVRALAQEILSRQAYARWRVPESDAPWLRKFYETLAQFFLWLHGLHVDAPVLYYLLLGGFVLVAAALLVHVVWSVRLTFAGRPEPTPSPPSSPGPAFAAEAAELASAGRYLDAAHRLELACIEALLRTGDLELRRHQPNRVLRHRVEAAGRLPAWERAEFLTLLDRLEARWFRDRRPGAQDRELYDAWQALHARLASGAEAP